MFNNTNNFVVSGHLRYNSGLLNLMRNKKNNNYLLKKTNVMASKKRNPTFVHYRLYWRHCSADTLSGNSNHVWVTWYSYR